MPTKTFKVCIWWDGFNGHEASRIYFLTKDEEAANLVDLARAMGWDWAVFESAYFETYILTDKSF